MPLIGEVSALVTALAWGTSNLLVKSLIRHFPPMPLTALRLSAASLFIWLALVASQQVTAVTELAPAGTLGLTVATLTGAGAGDALFATSLKFLPISVAFPVSTASYLIVAFLVSAVFLGESMGPYLVLGLPLTLVGIYLLTSRERNHVSPPRERRDRWKGLGLVLLASLCWVTTVSLFKVSIGENNLLVANAVRFPIAALVLLGFSSQTHPASLNLSRYPRHLLLLVGLAGVLNYGVGGLGMLFAVKYAGAARSALLTSVAPLFTLPFSVLFLKERVTVAVAVGTALTVAGVALVLVG